MLIPVTNETGEGVSELRRRLDAFYASTRDYVAFNEELPKPEYWRPIVSAIRDVVAQKGNCRVLEFGAGRSGFGMYLSEMRPHIDWHVQDVTATNQEYLTSVADSVHVGDISTIAGDFDVIFSTFVWEHITNPVETLGHLLRLLAADGRLFIASPRYDFPFYIPPSVRHRSRAYQLMVALWLIAQRVRGRWSPRSRFFIHLEPAVLSRAWYRDADAIHWASLYDLVRSAPGRFSVRTVEPVGDPSVRQWFFWRFLLLFVEIQHKH